MGCSSFAKYRFPMGVTIMGFAEHFGQYVFADMALITPDLVEQFWSGFGGNRKHTCTYVFITIYMYMTIYLRFPRVILQGCGIALKCVTYSPSLVRS